MKKILIVSLTKFYGGGESFISTHLNNIDGLDFYYFTASEKLFNMLPKYKKFFLKEISLINIVKLIKAFVREKKIDIVILNGGRSLFLAPLLYRHSKCVGIRHTLNASISNNYFFRTFYILCLNLCYCFMKAIVHVSKKSMSEQIFALKKAKIIYNGVSSKNITNKKKNNKNFVFIGRVSKEKGVDILINTFNIIYKDNKDIHLYLVGSGDIDESYSHCQNIHFEGFKTDLEKYYSIADWYISLTSQENCSIAVLDALSYGLPVITTPVGGNPELVKDNYNGFLVKQSVNELYCLYTNTLRKISNEQYEYLSNNALQSFLLNFNLNNQKIAYKNLLDSL